MTKFSKKLKKQQKINSLILQNRLSELVIDEDITIKQSGDKPVEPEVKIVEIKTKPLRGRGPPKNDLIDTKKLFTM